MVSASSASPLVAARGVSLRFGPRTVLDRVDLAVHAGEIVAPFELNGAGMPTPVRTKLWLVGAHAQAER